MDMKKLLTHATLSLVFLSLPHTALAKEWSLNECIQYALKNNISLQKNRLTQQSAWEDVQQSKSALLPSLTASTSQNINYNPFQNNGTANGTAGYGQSNVNKFSYNGTYGVNANWTLWNGSRNHYQVKLNNNIAQQAEMTTAVTAQSIQEQITLLYFQILYAQEAIVVNKESLATSIKNEERGKEMYQVGKISRADLSQLKAQRVQDEYNIVASESSLNDYKRQLKQILEITNNEDFNIVTPPTTSQEALQDIPAVHAVYMAAIEHRPEMKLAKLAIEGSDINIKMAKSLNMPTIGLTGTVATNTHSLDDNSWGKQIKNNLYSSAGVSLNIPLFDNRNKKTALNKALIDKENNQLDLRNKQTVLYANIENYWLQATNNQNKYKAALVNVKSESESYELLSEQFRLGLKNIVELMTGKTRLITAQQNELQSKYLTILHINLLHFYQTGQLK